MNTSPLRTVLQLQVILLASLLPLLVDPYGMDAFRLPKLVALRAVGLLCAGSVLAAWFSGTRRITRSRSALLVAAVVIVLPLALLPFSSHPLVSFLSLLTCIAAVGFFFATIEARLLDARWNALIAIPAVVNAVILFLERADIWNPFGSAASLRSLDPEELRTLMEAALLGNPNDVGSFLVLPTLVCAALALSKSARWRTLFAFAAIVCAAGVVASQTLTAISALAAAAVALLLLRRLRTALVGSALLILALSTAVLFFPPLRQRASLIRHAVQIHQYDVVVSARLTPFLVALEMGRDHPLTGVGPGNFGNAYFDYKLKVSEKYRRLLRNSSPNIVSWGEAHDDYLEFFATTGAGGTLLFTAATLLLAALSWKQRNEVVRNIALPAAVSLLVLALAQFPMQAAATIMSYVFIAGRCVACSEPLDSSS